MLLVDRPVGPKEILVRDKKVEIAAIDAQVLAGGELVANFWPVLGLSLD